MFGLADCGRRALVRAVVLFQAEDGIRDLVRSRGLGDVYKRQLPYQVNKARLIERMAELVRDKKIEGISDLRDESDLSLIHI